MQKKARLYFQHFLIILLAVGLLGCSTAEYLPSPGQTETKEAAKTEALPVKTSKNAAKAVDALKKSKRQSKEKAFLGIAHQVVDVSDSTTVSEKTAYQITFTIPDSAAQRAGLLRGDFILRYDGITLDEITTSERQPSLRNYLFEHKSVGEQIDLKMMRYDSWVIDDQGNRTSMDAFDWDVLKNHGGKQDVKNIQIEHNIKVFDTTVLLGKRVSRALEDLPVPEKVLPQYVNVSTQSLQFAEAVIEAEQLQDEWEDFKLRHARDELWQGLEDGMCRYDHFQYMRLRPRQTLGLVDKMAQAISNKGNSIELMQDWLIDEAAVIKLSAWTENATIDDWLAWLTQAANHIGAMRDSAFSALTQAEQQELSILIDGVMDRFGKSFYINHDKGNGQKVDQENRRFFALAKKVDLQRLYQAGMLAVQLYDAEMLKSLQEVVNLSTQSIFTKESSYGRIVVAGSENNQHRYPAAILIDTGGNEYYVGANQAAESAVSIIVDMEGDDRYWATQPYSLGGAKMAISALIDLQGDDRYVGRAFSQAASVLGVGVLIDASGNDRYLARRYGQGSAFMGIAVLKDLQGDDEYRADAYSQGLGGVCGIGLLHDVSGNDRYLAGLEKPSSYGVSGNFQSASQGVGIGFRGYARGGYGILLDESGDDVFEVGNFGLGTGYFFGLGVLVDRQGDDRYHASRYGLAASAHSAIGVVIESAGNDQYLGNHSAEIAIAWDLSYSFFHDAQGDDQYGTHQSRFSKGAAGHNGLAVLFDEQGNDAYYLDVNKPTPNDYHGGKSFAFRFDFNGDDRYLSVGDNDLYMREKAYIFSIDWRTNFPTENGFRGWLQERIVLDEDQ